MDKKLEKLEAILKSKENRYTRTHINISNYGKYNIFIEIETLMDKYQYKNLPWYMKRKGDEWHRTNVKSECKTFSSLESFDKPLQEAIDYYSTL